METAGTRFGEQYARLSCLVDAMSAQAHSKGLSSYFVALDGNKTRALETYYGCSEKPPMPAPVRESPVLREASAEDEDRVKVPENVFEYPDEDLDEDRAGPANPKKNEERAGPANPKENEERAGPANPKKNEERAGPAEPKPVANGMIPCKPSPTLRSSDSSEVRPPAVATPRVRIRGRAPVHMSFAAPGSSARTPSDFPSSGRSEDPGSSEGASDDDGPARTPGGSPFSNHSSPKVPMDDSEMWF